MDGGGRRGQCRPVQGYWLVEGTWVQGGGYAGWCPRATTICGRCGRWRRRLLESARAVAWQGVSFTRGGGGCLAVCFMFASGSFSKWGKWG